MELVILHLSDLHFGAERGNASQIDKRKLCLAQLLETIKKQPLDWQPNLICISGDIGYSGSEKDYHEASIWLTCLLEVTKLKPSQVILCAGNHDVNRAATRGLTYPPDATIADEWLSWPVPGHFLRPFESYISFCETFGIEPLKIYNEENYLVGARIVNGYRFVVLNSSWFCQGKNDKANLWVGLPHIQALESENYLKLTRDSTDVPCITLIHHPREWLNDSEHSGYATEMRPNTIDYLAERCDLILTGHTHGKIRKPDKIVEGAWHITAGATFDNAGHFNNFSIIKVNNKGFDLRRFELDPRVSDFPWQQKGENQHFFFSSNNTYDLNLGSENSLFSNASSIYANAIYPIELVDQKIMEEIEILKKSRFFFEFDTAHFAIALARKVHEGELSAGTDSTKRIALAWCSRVLSRTEEVNKAEEYLKLAQELGDCLEIVLAKALIISQKGDKRLALNTLATIDAASARTVSLLVVIHHEGVAKAIDWLKTVELDSNDLDSDGKFALISQLLNSSYWDESVQIANKLTDQDFIEAPALYHLRAMTHLLSSVPIELRNVVLTQIPFEASSFPLASDIESITARRNAQRFFTIAAENARQYKLTKAAMINEEYSLWLELMDPENSGHGIKKLEDKLRDPKSALRIVNLGLQFGIRIDIKAVEKEIERVIALSGGITEDAAIARFSLAFAQETQEDVANYVAFHFEDLSNYYNKKSLRSLQVEMYSKAGFIDKATYCLNNLLESGLSAAEEDRLKRIIAEAEGSDTLDNCVAQFNESNSLSDLYNLVDELESRGKWDILCEYGKLLFDRTRSVRDAERYVTALSKSNKTESVIEIVKENTDILALSIKMHFLYCWALYYEGQLLEARSELEKLKNYQEDINYRSLQINLGIGIGEWEYLSVLVANDFLLKDTRSSGELISAAQLAFHVGSPHAKDLLYAAAEKGKEDANILTSAYFLASTAGWEDSPLVSQWIQKAAELSGENGPVQSFTLQEILDQKPEWDRRESEIWGSLSRGDIPQFLAAESLNRSLIGLILYPAFANLSERDPRRRGAISTYSGNRLPTLIDKVSVIGIDATAILTLGFINLLDKVFDYYEEVYIPHSTLYWLFEEKQKASFHQPSRIKNAHSLRDLLATDVLEKLNQSTLPDSELSSQIGDELAMLIAEAEKVRDDNIHRIVVRPYPVHRINSLMEEVADLNSHSAVLSSCLSIVNKLRQKGQITAEEEKRAIAYLQINEKPWPNQPEINDGSILYLDSLAVSYFQHLGLLEKLHFAGFRTVVTPKEVSEINKLIAYESIASKIEVTIERIRSSVSSGIKSGKIKLGRKNNTNQLEKTSFSEHPSISIIALASSCDAIITDDRYFNQHMHIDNELEEVPILSTLNILTELEFTSSITSEEVIEYKTLLRRAGYFFVPVSEPELKSHILAAPIKNGKVIETAELKAIRESSLHVRMTKWLQYPKESIWLDTHFEVFEKVLKSLWNTEVYHTNVLIYSNWILDQIDILGWTHCLGSETGDYVIKTGRGTLIFKLIIPPPDISGEMKTMYWNWAEENVLQPIKEFNTELYAWLIGWKKNEILALVNEETLGNRDIIITPAIRSKVILAALNLMPPMIRISLLEDSEFKEECGLVANKVINFKNSDVSFIRSELYNAIRNLHSTGSEIEVTSKEGKQCTLKFHYEESKLSEISLSFGEKNLLLPTFAELSPSSSIRSESFELTVRDVFLPKQDKEFWQRLLLERPLDDEEMDTYNKEIKDTVNSVAQTIREAIKSNKCSIASLVPSSQKYYERLVGCYDGTSTQKDYVSGNLKEHISQLAEWSSFEGFLQSLYLSWDSNLTNEIDVDQLDIKDLIRAFTFLQEYGDRISQLGAIEIGIRVLSAKPEIEPFIVKLLKQIQEDDPEGSNSEFKLLSALIVLVYGELSRTRLFADAPPFYRRLAALSHSALIQRQLVNSGVDINWFYNWALTNRVEYYFLQNLVDLRSEPTWRHDFGIGTQIKTEFYHRILISAKKYKSNIIDNELHDLTFGTNPESINSQFISIYPYVLETVDDNPTIMPPEFSETIEQQLSTKELTPSTFSALLNLAMYYPIESYYSDLAARALKLGNYQLANITDRSQLIAILNGLAFIAAVTRSNTLANELKIVVRKYRNDAQIKLSMQEAFHIYLNVSASQDDLDEWRDFIGDCLTELAFIEFEENEGELLLSHLQCLCHIVPELWITCGRAEAALKAYVSCRHI